MVRKLHCFSSLSIMHSSTKLAVFYALSSHHSALSLLELVRMWYDRHESKCVTSMDEFLAMGGPHTKSLTFSILTILFAHCVYSNMTLTADMICMRRKQDREVTIYCPGSPGTSSLLGRSCLGALISGGIWSTATFVTAVRQNRTPIAIFDDI